MPETARNRIVDHYDKKGLEDVVLHALRAEHEDLTRLTPSDLNAIDEFHIRGRNATEELAAVLTDLTAAEILDVGAGLGGTARYLASTWGCRVTGIDLTPGYVSLAQKLSDLVALSSETEFRCASALSLPYQDGRFDVVWMEHVQMNIDDKERLARELTRVLREGGRLAFHEVFSDAELEPYFPVPWADGPSASFLVSAEDFRRFLEETGMQTEEWKDVSQAALAWASSTLQRLKDSGPPPLGLHLLMGETARAKLANVKRNLECRRIQVVQAVFSKL
jgi:ubiquinone/menaquinone biosynthesis C-methylase UbiE